MKIKSLGLKISLIVSLMIAVMVVIIILIVTSRVNSLVQEFTREEAKIANHTLSKSISDHQDEAIARARLIASTEEVVDEIIAGNVDKLRETLLPFTEGVDLITVIDTQGNVILRMHNDKTGDSLLNQKAVSTTLATGQEVRLIERGNTVGLTTVGTAAARDSNGSIVAVIKCGHDLALPEFVDTIKDISSCEITIFDGDTRLNTTFVDENGERVIGTQASDAVVETVINQRQDFATEIPLFGHTYAVHYSPLIMDNEVIGMLFAGVNIDGTLANERTLVNQVITAAIISVVVSILLVFLVSIFMINRPLRKIDVFADRLKTGDLGISSASKSTIDVRSSDEVGILARTLEQAYAQLQGYIGEIRDRMQDLSDGDLATGSDYEFQGDFTLIKESINLIVDNLNRTMVEINSSASQVSNVSRQIADGSQSLAQGSTEQASSVDELSRTIADVANKTRSNAEMAGKAAALANSIKDSAEKGSRQMDEMMLAVNEINEASSSISKVIKVIDDIAFQTNILALNAAVEAARAGQQGKGFAVVAEEVRNLAAKSAEAARDTGALIENSIEKANLGVRIAGETAESLAEIVSGINESSNLMNEIARSSEEQSIGINQINSGIDQVAQVVQQNSATAEESAAASEEMSGQSAMLQELISQFKLKGDDNRRWELPPARR